MYEDQIEALEDVLFSFNREIAVTIVMKTGEVMFTMKREKDTTSLSFLSHPMWHWNEYFSVLIQLMEDGGLLFIRERTNLKQLEQGEVRNIDKVYGMEFANEAFHRLTKNEVARLYALHFQSENEKKRPKAIICSEF